MLGSPTLRAMAGETPTATPSLALFNERQSQMVSALAEIIIPTTDTPGAIAAGTPAFIEMMAADWYTDTERGIFFKGLAALDTYCQASFGKSFLEASEEQRIAALRDAELQAAGYKSTGPAGFAAAMMKYVDEHSPFFTKIKELTVIGYYSSEVGATQEMAYNPMPMSYQGDYDFSTIGRHWSS
jgi:hypothetical protein